MAKYKVNVEVTARVEYEVDIEIEGNGEYRAAEEKAIALWPDEVPSLAGIKEYITDWEAEAEQTSWQCGECGTEIDSDNYDYKDQMCDDCLRTADRTLSSIKAQR